MLFGHQNNEVTQPTPDPVIAAPPAPPLNPLAVDPTTGVSLPVVPDSPADTDTEVANATPVETIAPTFAGVSLPPPPPPATPEPPTTAPLSVPTPDPIDPVVDVVEPDLDPISTIESPEEPVMPLDTPTTTPPPPPASADDLISLKQQALAQLTPLVDQLDQTPEEEFRTKMMMIQSTDDQSLIKDAYDAAQRITDEKSRAQALLDIINEINYFTAPRSDQQQA